MPRSSAAGHAGTRVPDGRRVQPPAPEARSASTPKQPEQQDDGDRDADQQSRMPRISGNSSAGVMPGLWERRAARPGCRNRNVVSAFNRHPIKGSHTRKEKPMRSLTLLGTAALALRPRRLRRPSEGRPGNPPAPRRPAPWIAPPAPTPPAPSPRRATAPAPTRPAPRRPAPSTAPPAPTPRAPTRPRATAPRANPRGTAATRALGTAR
jgi:hypothetical protein